MSRFFRRPRNMPRFSRGRMFNRRTGGYAPSLYSGRRPRRWAHRRSQTQTSPYGAGGGGRRQYHAGHSGHAGNVYGAMMHHARRQGGVNMGLLTAPNRTRSSRQLKHYRKGLSGAGRDAYTDFMGGRTRRDFGSASEFRAARRQAKRERSQARRQYAASYRNPYTGTSDRRVTTMSHQNPYTGVRTRGATRFTTPFSAGARNRFKRHTKRYQGATNRYRWGQKNPTMRTFSSGGLRFMSPRGFERAQAAVREKEGIYNQQKDFQRSLAERRRKARLNSPRFKRQQKSWLGQLMNRGQFGRLPGEFAPQSRRFGPGLPHNSPFGPTISF